MNNAVRESRLTSCVVRLVYLQNIAILGKFARILLWLLGIDIPSGVRIDTGLKLSHPTAGIVVHPRTTIGSNVTLFHGVTLGRADAWLPEPPINEGGIEVGSGAVIGAGAVVLFSTGQIISIGQNAVIGANAVVLSDVPPGEIWVGNPAKPLRKR